MLDPQNPPATPSNVTETVARNRRSPMDHPLPVADHPDGKAGDVLTVEFTVCGVPCVGLNGGASFKHNEAFSFQIATENQEETDRYWNAIVGNGGEESACGWCKDKWGVSWPCSTMVIVDPDSGIPASRKWNVGC